MLEDVLAANVLGSSLGARDAVKRMSIKHGGQGGTIVNSSSGAATAGGPNDGILYAASEGAVNSLTIGLAQEVAGEGIRVNTVAPGLTETDMPGEKLKTLGPGLPMGRPGQPIEVAPDADEAELERIRQHLEARMIALTDALDTELGVDRIEPAGESQPAGLPATGGTK